MSDFVAKCAAQSSIERSDAGGEKLEHFWLRRSGGWLSDGGAAALVADDWRYFREMRRLGRNTDPMSAAIESDDVDGFVLVKIKIPKQRT
jgi:hypothetical protein